MHNRKSQAETEVDSSTNDEPLPSAQMPQNPMLAAVLNWLGVVEVIIFAVFLITIVWTDSDVVKKLLASDLIAFFLTLILYWSCCYEKKKSH